MEIDSGVYGGEGGIRTPDTRKGMPDFESGAFNRALPPLRSVNASKVPKSQRFPGSLQLVAEPFCEGEQSKPVLYESTGKSSAMAMPCGWLAMFTVRVQGRTQLTSGR